MYKYIVGFSALLIATIVAIFSVTGFAKVFAGAFWLVVIMFGSLELGKLVVASFLYKLWNYHRFPKWLRKYFIVGLCFLIFLTSIGVFGFLTNAHQSITFELDKVNQTILLLEKEESRLNSDKDRLIEEKNQLSKNLQNDLDNLIFKEETRYLDSKYRRRSIDKYQPIIDDKEKQIKNINNRLLELSNRISDYKLKMIETGVDVGPIVSIANMLGLKIEKIIVFIIFIVMFVFDPLAVSLIIALNIIIEKEKEDKINEESRLREVFENNTKKRRGRPRKTEKKSEKLSDYVSKRLKNEKIQNEIFTKVKQNDQAEKKIILSREDGGVIP